MQILTIWINAKWNEMSSKAVWHFKNEAFCLFQFDTQVFADQVYGKTDPHYDLAV